MNRNSDSIPTGSGSKVVIGVVAVVVILAAAFSIIANLRSHTAGSRRPVFVGLGQAVARTAAKTLQEHGAIVLILAANHQTDGFPQFDSWQAFGAELKKHPGLRLVATEVIATDAPGETGLTRSQLDTIIRKYPNINLIVSLCGIPPWDSSAPLESTTGGPKLLVVENEPATPLAGYFANGSLVAALMPRLVPETNPALPTTPATWFDRQYEVFTAENYPAQPVGGP